MLALTLSAGGCVELGSRLGGGSSATAGAHFPHFPPLSVTSRETWVSDLSVPQFPYLHSRNGASVVQGVKALLASLASCGGALGESQLLCLLWAWESNQHGPRTRAPATHFREPDGVPGSWLCCGHLEDELASGRSLSAALPFKEVNKSERKRKSRNRSRHWGTVSWVVTWAACISVWSAWLQSW